MAIAALHGAVQNPAYRLGDTIWPARGRSLRAGLQSSEAVVLKLRLAPRVACHRDPSTTRQLPDVGAAPSKTEGLEAHRLQGTVAGENDEVGPGNLAAIFLLDRPQETARLVEIRVVPFNGATCCWPAPAPPRPSVMRYVPALCHAIRMNSP